LNPSGQLCEAHGVVYQTMKYLTLGWLGLNLMKEN